MAIKLEELGIGLRVGTFSLQNIHILLPINEKNVAFYKFDIVSITFYTI